MSLWGKGITVWNSLDPGQLAALRARIESGEAVQLHGTFWIDRQHWEHLPRWEQDRLRVLAVGRQAHSAVVVGRSAATLWRIDVLGGSGVVELALRGGRRPRSRSSWPPNVRYRTTRFLPGEVLEHKSIFYTSLSRTLVDICRWDGFAAGLVAVESCMRDDLSFEGLLPKVEALRGTRGIGTVARVVRYASSNSESAGESFAKALMIDAGVDMAKVVQNIELSLDGHIFRADFLYDNWLIIEFDGNIKYSGAFGNPVEVITQERRREKIMRNEGFAMLRCSWDDLRSGAFISRLHKMVALRASSRI